MDSVDILDKFTHIFSEYYYDQLLDAVENNTSLIVDFQKLERIDPELADRLFDEPEEVIQLAEEAIRNIDVGETPEDVIRVRFSNIPDTHGVKIRDIRGKHINKFICVKGIIKQASEVRPEVIMATFECRACGNTISMPQEGDALNKPYMCDQCGNKRGFDMISRKLRDTQRIELEEIPEDLEGSPQPRKIGVFIREDLVDPKFQKKIIPGSKVVVYGIVKDMPIKLDNSGKESKRRDLYMEGNNLEKIEKEYEDIEISKEEEKKIKELSQNPKIYDIFVKSIAPSIYGYHDMKYSVLLQLFGGVKKQRPDGIVTRGDIHMLLVGDPGTAKSQLLKYVSRLAPKARYVVGKSTSGAGLCVSPNSLVLTNPGGMATIQNTVEHNLTNPVEYRPGIWKQDNINTIKIQSLSDDLKIQSQYPQSVWKLKAPDKIYKITLSSGKSIELTPNTKLFTINKGITSWKKSKDLIIGDYIATPRKLIGGDKIPYTLELIRCNPKIHNIESFVRSILEKIKQKTTIREISRKLQINENNLYHNWTKEDSKGSINLNALKSLANKADINLDQIYDNINTVSLYNGKPHTVPKKLTKDLIYIAGLLLGDGDIRKTPTNSYSIRLSNSCPEIQKIFREVLTEQFSLKYDIQNSTKARPESTRTHSRVLGEILLSLGLPLSPKEDLLLTSHILHLPNDYLSEFIAGLFDADGSVNLRKSKGSDTIEFTTTLKTLAKQLQLILLRYEIYSTLRVRNATKNKTIQGKKLKYVLEIRGKQNVVNFYRNISLKHPEKKKKLRKLFEIYQSKVGNTNIDIIPGIHEPLKKVLIENNIPLNKIKFRKNISRKALQDILKKLNRMEITKEKNLLLYLEKIAHSDIFWEKISNIETYAPDYDYVYDLTVEDSHNFVVDGILVHNTATVVKDEFMRGWALEAGALVLANNGMAMIDELDKMGKEDRSAMHEVMEQQTVTVSKANVQATLNARTTILAAANPKFGRFDPYENLGRQIDLPETLISRFDLIFPIRDKPDKKKDTELVRHILESHEKPDAKIPVVDEDLFRKYISYAKAHCHPKLTKAAQQEIENFYVGLRSKYADEEGSAVPITTRQLEAIIRLSEASARVRLSDKVLKRDAETAIRLITDYLKKVGIDPETGRFDIDRLESGTTTSQRNKIKIILRLIEELQNETENGVVPVADLIAACEDQGIEDAEEIVKRLKREGEIFEPMQGYIKKV